MASVVAATELGCIASRLGPSTPERRDRVPPISAVTSTCHLGAMWRPDRRRSARWAPQIRAGSDAACEHPSRLQSSSSRRHMAPLPSRRASWPFDWTRSAGTDALGHSAAIPLSSIDRCLGASVTSALPKTPTSRPWGGPSCVSQKWNSPGPCRRMLERDIRARCVRLLSGIRVCAGRSVLFGLARGLLVSSSRRALRRGRRVHRCRPLSEAGGRRTDRRRPSSPGERPPKRFARMATKILAFSSP